MRCSCARQNCSPKRLDSAFRARGGDIPKERTVNKTNAMRMLDTRKIEYQMLEYPVRDGRIDGVSVAEKMGEPQEQVFKTLVTQSQTDRRTLFVFVIPVAEELDLKKAAQACGQKSVAMLPQKALLPSTGYIHGGCSPVGMKKSYPTYLDSSARQWEKIFVSGGKIGLQIRLAPIDLLRVVGGSYAPLTRERKER